jgi:phosphoribosyl 1,2-cyclic phosphodiesterase
MIELCALASGSNGNSYYVGNSSDAILVDAGISTKRLLARMSCRNLDPGKIRAVFLSHEHTDHSGGIRVLSKRLNLTIWMSEHTYYSLPKSSRPAIVRFFRPGDVVEVASFRIHTFLKNHDAVEPSSFRIENAGFSTGVFTDIGAPCEVVKREFAHCRAVFMETNYDEEMLVKGPYPFYLKKRILSDQGHLSNVQAFNLVDGHSHPELKCVFLSHLSQENNTPVLAMSVFDCLSEKMDIRLTNRYDASEVYRLE